MMKKKRKAVRAGLIAFSAAAMMYGVATPVLAEVAAVPLDIIDKWHNEYLQ